MKIHKTNIPTCATYISILCSILSQSTARPQEHKIQTGFSQEKLFYDVGKSNLSPPGGNIHFDDDGSPVEDTLRTLLALKHKSHPVEAKGFQNYKKILDQLPVGISPIIKHISELVPNHPDLAEPNAEKLKSLQLKPKKNDLTFKLGNQQLKEKKPQHHSVKKYGGEYDDNGDYGDDIAVDGDDDTSGRGRAPTGVDDAIKYDMVKKQVENKPALHIETTDWSRESRAWTFKGGEWSMMDLPDSEHPDVPATDVPGPALVAISDDPLKKIYLRREELDLKNVTLHFQYFLSSKTSYPPELKVFVVTSEDVSHELPINAMTDLWQHNTIDIPYEGPYKISFEARLMDASNEIALDDITIKGYRMESLGSENSSNLGESITNNAHVDESEVTTSISTNETQTGEVVNTSNSVDVDGNQVSQTNNNEDKPEGGENVSVEPVGGEGVSVKPEGGEDITVKPEGGEHTSIKPGVGEESALTPDTNEEIPEEGDSSAEIGQGNKPENGEGVDDIKPIENSEKTTTTLQIEESNVTTTDTSPSVGGSIDEDNDEVLPGKPGAEGNNETIYETTISQDNDKFDLNGNSGMADIAGMEEVDDRPLQQSGGSWTVFKIFFALTAVGGCVIGILYWRNRKRRDDEIPVFSRQAYTDFHNPTYTEDQNEVDSSTLRPHDKVNNYRSFMD